MVLRLARCVCEPYFTKDKNAAAPKFDHIFVLGQFQQSVQSINEFEVRLKLAEGYILLAVKWKRI